MKKLLNFLLKNRWLKLLSLLLAVIAWVYVSRKTCKTDQAERVPLVCTVPGDKFILSSTSDEVRLSLRGPTPAMNRLNKEDLAAEINVLEKLDDKLPDTSEAPQPITLLIEPSDIRNLAPNIVVTDIRPSRVTIQLDQMGQKRLTVEQKLTGEVKSGLRIHKAYPVPKQVIGRGPKSILAQIDTIETLPVPISNLDAGKWLPSLALNTKLRLKGRQVVKSGGRTLDCLRLAPSTVVVWIEVVPEATKKISHVPVEVRGLPGFLYTLLTPDKTKPYTTIPTVEIRGPKELLEQPRLRAFVDLTEIDNPEETLDRKKQVEFSARSGIEILSEPPAVVVQIKPETPK